MNDILIYNAKICLPDRIINSGVLIKDGIIHKVGIGENDVGDCEKINARGDYLLPGFIDIHTHLDDIIGGYNLADSYRSGTKTALVNGITTIFSFITQKKNETLSASINKIQHKASGNIFCNLGWHLTPAGVDSNNISDLQEKLKNGFRTIKLYTTYKEAGIYFSYEQIKLIAEVARENNAVILVHCEDEDILADLLKNKYDFSDSFSHSLMRPEKAEITAVKKIIQIAKETDAGFHVVHVSSPESVDLINEAKNEARVTFETCPQYLLFNNSFLKGENGFAYLCTPPLRDETSQLSLYEKSINGEIDIYATDHCAFNKKDKSEHKNNLMKVPKGLPGIGALVYIIYEINKYKGDKCFLHMAKHLSENPSKIISQFPKKGIIREGSDADLILIGTGEKRFIKSTGSDCYDPYNEYETDLNISYVFLRGEIVVRENMLISNEQAKGQMI